MLDLLSASAAQQYIELMDLEEKKSAHDKHLDMLKKTHEDVNKENSWFDGNLSQEPAV